MRALLAQEADLPLSKARDTNCCVTAVDHFLPCGQSGARPGGAPPCTRHVALPPATPPTTAASGGRRQLAPPAASPGCTPRAQLQITNQRKKGGPAADCDSGPPAGWGSPQSYFDLVVSSVWGFVVVIYYFYFFLELRKAVAAGLWLRQPLIPELRR